MPIETDQGLIEYIETDQGPVDSVYVNHGDGQGEQLVWQALDVIDDFEGASPWMGWGGNYGMQTNEAMYGDHIGELDNSSTQIHSLEAEGLPKFGPDSEPFRMWHRPANDDWEELGWGIEFYDEQDGEGISLWDQSDNTEIVLAGLSPWDEHDEGDYDTSYDGWLDIVWEIDSNWDHTVSFRREDGSQMFELTASGVDNGPYDYINVYNTGGTELWLDYLRYEEF
jgi:hypothetical protein